MSGDPSSRDRSPDPAVYDHLRPARSDDRAGRPDDGGDAGGDESDGEDRPPDGDDRPPDGVYRVVGTGDPVALLRVADADGRRTATGRLLRVPRSELSAFRPAENPDAGLSPLATLRDGIEGLGILVRELLGR